MSPFRRDHDLDPDQIRAAIGERHRLGLVTRCRVFCPDCEDQDPGCPRCGPWEGSDPDTRPKTQPHAPARSD